MHRIKQIVLRSMTASPRQCYTMATQGRGSDATQSLRARREPWLVCDPKPHVAAADDRGYDATQHLLNCTERLRADPAGLAARMAGLLEVDPVRLRRWLFARCVLESPGEPALADVARRLPPD